VRLWDAAASRETACARRAQNVVTALALVGDGPRALVAQAGLVQLCRMMLAANEFSAID
jgi:hypothetical protein